MFFFFVICMVFTLNNEAAQQPIQITDSRQPSESANTAQTEQSTIPTRYVAIARKTTTQSLPGFSRY